MAAKPQAPLSASLWAPATTSREMAFFTHTMQTAQEHMSYQDVSFSLLRQTQCPTVAGLLPRDNAEDEWTPSEQQVKQHGK